HLRWGGRPAAQTPALVACGAHRPLRRFRESARPRAWSSLRTTRSLLSACFREAPAALEDDAQWTGELLKPRLVSRAECRSIDLVQELRDCEDAIAPVADGHAEHVPGPIAGLPVDLGVEFRMVIGVLDAHRLAGAGDASRDAGGDRN